MSFPAGLRVNACGLCWIENKKALELFEEGIRRGRLQLPVGHGDDAMKLNGDLVSGIHDLSRMLGVKGKALLADGDDVGTWRLRVQLLRLGEMLCNGEGMVSDYILGHGFRRAAITRIRAVAGQAEIPRSILGELLSAIEHSAASSDGLAQSMRMELCCWALPKFDQLPEDRELEDFVDQLLEKEYVHGYISPTESNAPQFVTPTDGRLTWRREQIIALLRGHPCPFDKIATVRRMGKLVAAFVQSLDYMRTPRILDPLYSLRYQAFRIHWRWLWREPRGMRYWPAQLKPDFSVEGLGHTESARAELAELGPYLDAKQFASMQPPTEAEVTACRSKLRRARNPVGRMLARLFASSDYRFCAKEYRTALEETRALLTKRLNP